MLPEIVADLQTALYPPLAAVANRWNQSMKIDVSYPEMHEEYLERCHAVGQTRPTPLLLSYGEGDWNALHQDVSGENVFQIQAAILISKPRRIGRRASMCRRTALPHSVRAEVVSLQRVTAWPSRSVIARYKAPRAGTG